MLMGMKEKSN